MKDVEAAYAVVRVDNEAPSDALRFTVRRIVWDEALVEAEVRRLSKLNADKSCRYFWQYTRVDRPDLRRVFALLRLKSGVKRAPGRRTLDPSVAPAFGIDSRGATSPR